MSHIKYHICKVFFKKDCRKIYEQKNVTLTLVITAFFEGCGKYEKVNDKI